MTIRACNALKTRKVLKINEFNSTKLMEMIKKPTLQKKRKVDKRSKFVKVKLNEINEYK